MVESVENIYDILNTDGVVKYLNSSPNQDKFSFSLGGDMEGLILKRNGRGYIPAKNTKFNSTSPTAWVGKDGSGNQIEFRFKPSENPYIVINNFQNSLKIFRDWAVQGNSGGVIFGNYKHSQCLGGHIHFSIPLTSDLVKKLDYYLAVPVMMLSDTKELVSRCKSSYGKLSNTEGKKYGGEYRTLGSFSVEKALTCEVFVLAGLIGDQFNHFSSSKLSSKCIKSYYEGDKKYFVKNHLTYIKKEILMNAFERFKKWGWAFLQILRFLNRLNQAENIISSKTEVLRNWNLISNRITSKYRIVINSDDYLLNLKPVLLEKLNTITDLDEDLLIYGVKSSRSTESDQIWVSSMLYEKLKNSIGSEQLEKYHVQEGSFGTSEVYKYSIGLSHKLRKKLNEKPKDKKTFEKVKIIQEVIGKCAA